MAAFAFVLAASAIVPALNAAAEEPRPPASGRFWYETVTEEKTYGMDLEIVDAIAVQDELENGRRVKVLLVGEPLDREAFVKAFEETGVLLFTLTRLQIDESVTFDVCSDEDGSNPEICGLHFSGPGLSSSSSGFGVFGDITEAVGLDDARVHAKLKTAEPKTRSETTYGFDVEFDLPIIEKPPK